MTSEPSRIACFGDSITKGNVSFNWVKKMSTDFKSSSVTFKNFGVNGELAYNGLKRLDQIIDFAPDLVTLMFGSNDVMAACSIEDAQFYMKRESLPQMPNLAWYVENMRAIIEQLQSKTKARIVCISIPILGEDLDDIPNQLVIRYNAELKNLCTTYSLDLLDLNQAMVSYLEQHPPVKPYEFSNDRKLVIQAAIKKYMWYRSWDNVSAAHGFILSHDGIHLNNTSGQLLVNLLKDYLDS
jgi:lysophospholipase L1-like esterase